MFGISDIIRKQREEEERALAMTPEELAELPEGELMPVLSARVLRESLSMEDSQCLEVFQGAKRVLHVLNTFDMEVQNGGLCQFFVNSSRALASYVLPSLQEVGARGMYELFSKFLAENEIDLTDLERFAIFELSDYADREEEYPFEEFDEEYYELCAEEPLEELLEPYCRARLGDF